MQQKQKRKEYPMRKYIILTISAGLWMAGAALDLQAQSSAFNSGNIYLFSGARMACFGNFTNNGSFVSNGGAVYFTGNALQTVDGTQTVNAYNCVLQNPGHVRLENRLEIGSMLTFVSGKLLTDRADMSSRYVHFLNGAGYTGLSNTMFVDGAVRKTGNTSFVFPVGEGNDVQSIAISAPADPGDHFTAYYTHTDPGTDVLDPTSFGPCIHNVSRCEYWVLDRTGGSSDVHVSLEYDANSCGIIDPCDLLLAHWNGSQWESLGNGGTTGSPSAGTLTGGNGCGNCGSPVPVSSFSPFTLASFSPVNPLPVELLRFDAQAGTRQVDLFWETATEINNNYFAVERSVDLIHYEYVMQVSGAGNSNEIRNYSATDFNPYKGISYYRLRQTDYDGHFTYYGPRSVYFTDTYDVRLYPNPAQTGSFVNMAFSSDATKKSIEVFDETGRVIYIKQTFQENKLVIPLQNLSAGIYYVQISQNNAKEVQKLIIY